MNKIFKVVFCKSTGTFVAVSENSKSQKKNTKSSKMCGIGKAVGFVLSTLLTQQAIAIPSVIQGDTNLNTSSNYTSIFGVNNNVLPLLNGDEVTAFQIAQNHTLVAGSLNTSSGRNNTLLGAANYTIGNDSTSIGGTNYSEGNNNLSLSTTRTSTNNNMSDPMVAMYLSKVSKVYDELAVLTQLLNEESKLTQVEIEANLLKLQTDGVISLNTYEGILAKGLTRQIASIQAAASLGENGMSLYNNTVGNANIALGDANYTGGNMNTTTGTYNKTSGSHNTINGLGNELSGDGNVVLGMNNISNGNENIVIGSQFSKELPEISAKYSDVVDRFLSGSINTEQYTAELEVLVREVGLMGSEVNLIQGNNNTVLGKVNLVSGSSNQHIGSNGFISGKVNALVGEKLTVNGDYNSAIGSHTSVKGIGNTVNAQGLSALTTQSVQSDATTNFFERMSQNGSTASMYQALQNKSLYQDVVVEYINAETGSNLQFENEILYDTVLGGGALLEQSDLYAAYRALTPEQIAELEVLAQERMTSFDAEYSVLMQEAQQRAADTGVTEYEAFVAVLEENGKLSALIDMQDVNTATITKESTVVGDHVVGLGAGITVNADDAVAIGKEATVSHDGSVALGAGSTATGVTLPNEAYLVGGTATAEVNIGDRRITGLAAGSENTDAVNVAQLKEVSAAVEGITLKDLSSDSWHIEMGKNNSIAQLVDDQIHASNVIGSANTVTNPKNELYSSKQQLNILGHGNSTDNSVAYNLIGSKNRLNNSSTVNVLGENNSITNAEATNVLGNGNSVAGTYNFANTVTGQGNKVLNNSGSLVAGLNNTVGISAGGNAMVNSVVGSMLNVQGTANNVFGYLANTKGSFNVSFNSLNTIHALDDLLAVEQEPTKKALLQEYRDLSILNMDGKLSTEEYQDQIADLLARDSENSIITALTPYITNTPKTEGNYNIVMGSNNHVIGDGNLALGSGLVLEGDNRVALGNNTKVDTDGSVALGLDSYATGLTLNNEAYLVGGTASAEVNIGDRRITGLAAGSNDSDAVNVEQLKSLAQNVENSVSTLNDRINLTDQNLAQYQTANDQKVNDLEAGLSTTNQAIDQNKADSDAQIGDIQTGMNATNNTVAQNKIDADQKAGQLEVGLQLTNDQLNDLSAGLASTNDKVGELETGLAATNVKVGELEAGLADTNTQLGQTNDKIDKNQALNDAKFGELETGLASTNDKVGELQTGLADTNAQLGQTNDKIDQNQALNDAKFGDLETGLASTNDKVGKLESGLADTNAKVDQNQALNDAKFGELETGLASTNDKVGELQTGLADTNTQLGLTNDKIDQNQALNDAKIGDIETGLADTNTQLGLTNDKIDQNQALNDAKIGDIESGLASTNDKVGEIETGLVDTNAKVDQNQATNDAKFGELETGLASTNDKVGELETDLADTNQSLETLKTETNTQIGNLDSELDKTQNDLQAAIENSVKYGQKDGDVDYSAVVLQGEDGSRITNLANGEQDSDAVNLGQVKNLIDSIGPGSLSGNVIQYDLNADGTVNKDSVVLGGESGTLITNVQEGKVEAGSTDAINGSQLNAVYSNLSSSLGGGASWNAETSTYTAPVYELSTGSYKGVDSALTALDAKDQALEGKINNLEQSFANQLNATDQNIRKVEKRLSAGIAQALSMESAPYVAGKLSYALGAAHYNGEQAIGGTLRLTAENGNWSVITGVSGASEGGAAFKIGMSGVFD